MCDDYWVDEDLLLVYVPEAEYLNWNEVMELALERSARAGEELEHDFD